MTTRDMMALVGLTRPPEPGTQTSLMMAVVRSDSARLILADWLDEHDEPERAARLRLPRVDGPNLTPGRWSVCRRETTYDRRTGKTTSRLRRLIVDVDRVTPEFAVVRDVGLWKLDTLLRCTKLERQEMIGDR